MVDRSFPNASVCVNCLSNLETWISSDGGTDWYQIPYNTTQNKTANRPSETEIRLEGTPTVVCGTESKSWEYECGFWACTSHPIEAYVFDGESYLVRVINGTLAGTDPQEQFTAVYDDDGFTRDTESTNPELRTLLFKVSSPIERTNYTPPPLTEAPLDPNFNTGSTNWPDGPPDAAV